MKKPGTYVFIYGARKGQKAYVFSHLCDCNKDYKRHKHWFYRMTNAFNDQRLTQQAWSEMRILTEAPVCDTRT